MFIDFMMLNLVCNFLIRTVAANELDLINVILYNIIY